MLAQKISDLKNPGYVGALIIEKVPWRTTAEKTKTSIWQEPHMSRLVSNKEYVHHKQRCMIYTICPCFGRDCKNVVETSIFNHLVNPMAAESLLAPI